MDDRDVGFEIIICFKIFAAERTILISFCLMYDIDVAFEIVRKSKSFVAYMTFIVHVVLLFLININELISHHSWIPRRARGGGIASP